jgi:hypothetical protein
MKLTEPGGARPAAFATREATPVVLFVLKQEKAGRK